MYTQRKTTWHSTLECLEPPQSSGQGEFLPFQVSLRAPGPPSMERTHKSPPTIHQSPKGERTVTGGEARKPQVFWLLFPDRDSA